MYEKSLDLEEALSTDTTQGFEENCMKGAL
jgi:hypothetical protein